MLRWIAVWSLTWAWGLALAQAPGGADPFASLNFLLGNWAAKARGQGATVAGTYSFAPELDGHVLARHATNIAGCQGPKTFNCEHGDLLYVYPEGQALKAIYFDNEGHVIHYDVSTPAAGAALFLSDAAQPGPQFRLVYTLRGQIMAGKFEMRMPGSADWHTYLEWSGAKQ